MEEGRVPIGAEEFVQEDDRDEQSHLALQWGRDCDGKERTGESSQDQCEDHVGRHLLDERERDRKSLLCAPEGGEGVSQESSGQGRPRQRGEGETYRSFHGSVKDSRSLSADDSSSLLSHQEPLRTPCVESIGEGEGSASMSWRIGAPEKERESGGGKVGRKRETDFLETLDFESKAPRVGFWKDWSRFQRSNWREGERRGQTPQRTEQRKGEQAERGEAGKEEERVSRGQIDKRAEDREQRGCDRRKREGPVPFHLPLSSLQQRPQPLDHKPNPQTWRDLRETPRQ
jgi:hypothetical protein